MRNFYDEVLKIEENTLVLNRTYHKNGTHGELTFPDGTMFDILENPWLDNQRRISCVPEGTYTMEMRYSPVVKRTSGGAFARGWEVMDVPDRDYIMFHPGNYVKDTAGCMLVGSSKGFQGNEPVVWSSRPAFRKFMDKMNTHSQWVLVIRHKK